MFDDRRVTPWWISHNLHWNHGFMVSNEYWIHEKRGPSLGVRSKATEVRHFWKTCVKAVDPRNGMGSKSRSSNIWAGDSWVLSKSPIQWSLSHIISYHIAMTSSFPSTIIDHHPLHLQPSQLGGDHHHPAPSALPARYRAEHLAVPVHLGRQANRLPCRGDFVLQQLSQHLLQVAQQDAQMPNAQHNGDKATDSNGDTRRYSNTMAPGYFLETWGGCWVCDSMCRHKMIVDLVYINWDEMKGLQNSMASAKMVIQPRQDVVFLTWILQKVNWVRKL